MLCDTCENLLGNLSKFCAGAKDGAPPHFKYKHYRTATNFWYTVMPHELQRAAETGCFICMRLMQVQKQVQNGKKSAANSLEGSNRPTKPLEISCFLQERGTAVPRSIFISFRLGGIGFEVGIARHKEDTQSDISVTHSLTAMSTGSDECFQLADYWIKTCLATHEKCAELLTTREDEWYPTRLIDIGELGLTLHFPRLCLSKKSAIKGGYATLSHRWGPSTPAILSLKNIGEFMTGFPRSSLPQTFQDALLITKRLGLRYLWIDSLCILQSGSGSTEDWHKESAAMGRTYQNAYCNISATSSQSHRQGLFYDRDVLASSEAGIEFSWNRGSNKDYAQEYHKVFDMDIFSRELDTADLLNRGWVLQERLLAPRIIHFGETQIYWECNELQACETLPYGPPKSRESWPDPSYMFLKQRLLLASNFSTLIRNTQEYLINQQWARIVEVYTKYGLTKQTDKLIALSGVAKHFAAVASFDVETYFAGHWRHSLPQSLFWVRKTPGNIRDVNSSLVAIAPSWSWASAEGTVEFLENYQSVKPIGFGDGGACVTLLDVRTGLVSADPTGQVVNGAITIQGTLFSLQGFIDAPETAVVAQTRISDFGRGLRHQKPEDDAKQTILFKLDYVDIKQEGLWGIVLSKESSTYEPDLVTVGGLLLARNEQQGSFQRAGAFYIKYRGEYQKCYVETEETITIV